MSSTENSSPHGGLSPRSIPLELLQRYEKSGPRYTSYPTAPQFHTDFDRTETLRRWREHDKDQVSGLSLYVHIPFCRSRCTYCGCSTRIGVPDAVVDDYVGALLDTADWTIEALSARRPVAQLALGGGTPTHLTPSLMTRLVSGLDSRFDFDASAERAIEVDPRWIDTSYLDLLVDLGFNRFSFGVQDLDAGVQKNIARVLSPDRLATLLEHLHGRGRRAINLDLIYGLPGQRPDTFEATVRRVIELQPSRIALFGYAHVPWVSPHQRRLEELGIPAPPERAELFGLAFEMLIDAGWRHVGMDHFARPDDELVQALEQRSLTRSFMGYTTRKGLDLVPLGATAIGSVAATYVQNAKELEGYLTARGLDRWVRGFVMSGEDVLRREIVLDLLCNFYLDTDAVAARHAIDFGAHFDRELRDLRPFERDGLVVLEDGAIRVTDLGRFFVRNIAMTFDEYLRREGDVSARYSKTI